MSDSKVVGLRTCYTYSVIIQQVTDTHITNMVFSIFLFILNAGKSEKHEQLRMPWWGLKPFKTSPLPVLHLLTIAHIGVYKLL